VDPVSHVAFGYTVAQAVRPAVPRLALAACLGALAPDVDSVFMPAGWDIYLRAHEIGTHSLIGSVPVALAVTVVARGRTRAPVLPLFQIAQLAVASHLALDAISGARFQWAWPFFGGRTRVPLVAMAEPWVIALLVLGFTAVLVSRQRVRRTAQSVLMIFTICLALKGLWLAEALRTLDTGALAPMSARIIEARWFSLRQWNVFGRTASNLVQVRIQPDGPPSLLASWPVDADADLPLASASLRLSTVTNLRAVHELTFPRQLSAANGMTEVLWSDIRFCWKPSEDPPAPLQTFLTAGIGPKRIACALWMGGAYNNEGRVVSQRVYVFGLWQTRPVRP
jgi:membrane-bound metal-dependent hydrolase YbcI (DUF457 family)